VSPDQSVDESRPLVARVLRRSGIHQLLGPLNAAERLCEVANLIVVLSDCIPEAGLIQRCQAGVGGCLCALEPRVVRVRQLPPSREPYPRKRCLRIDLEGTFEQLLGLRETPFESAELTEARQGRCQTRSCSERLFKQAPGLTHSSDHG